ncbi:MAG TPA: 4-hydroxy-3-methylbut-2-enyl diphosphate reductase [Oligoflexia bacterium]|nr:4-hydroxy-3-methylbut-2-enyl diphosphate reductase [Oligoflexia bacterium]HMR24884.1 4-hydroxy-3-methylbut-2-enyl diphosphate reductase [Oligoflexia bacterium]
MKKLLLASPRGFCAGVVRAVDIVDLALKHYGTPLYVRKEIVHNQSVVQSFKDQGVVFIEELSEAPKNSRVIFSAHGVSPQVREEARGKGLKIIDATCPLVTKVHSEVHKYKKLGYSIVLIGHKEHEEVEGTFGEAPDIIQIVGHLADIDRLKNINPEKVVALTQTTLSVDEANFLIDALKVKYPKLTTPPKGDICYATQNRQDAVRALVKAGIDLLLVIGSQNSSNSKRLAELATSLGVSGYLVDSANEIESSWLDNKKTIGLTAGASAPEYLVQQVVEKLKPLGFEEEDFSFVKEDVLFQLPKELQNLQENQSTALPTHR